ncbi:MAG: phage tail protein [Bacteroidaceae bacterium]|nr:phage tail protein [Bacteroidaceae bacterium]
MTIGVESTDVLPFSVGDTIEVSGAIYTLNQLPSIEKIDGRHFRYSATFEGLHYILLNTAWMMPFSALNDTLAGDLRTFAEQIVSNVERVQPGQWVLGTVQEDTDTKVLAYTDTNCLDVLQGICEEWEMEFSITKNQQGKYVLSIFKEIGTQLEHTFHYGATGGLYDIQRNGVEDNDFGTRIYFYGGNKNIPNDYFNQRQSSRLCLANKVHGATLIPNPDRKNSYFEMPDAVSNYGRIERTKVFDEIYPNRIGSITSIDAGNRLKFADSTMFDLNAKDAEGNSLYLIAGTTAKIHFNTGSLAGYDFDIHSYDHETRTFTINELQDENNYKFPSEDNEAFRVAVGDKYILTDIIMPSSYVTQAQNDLQRAAEDWYEKHCAPAVEYTITLDDMYIRWLSESMLLSSDEAIFHTGDKITVEDSQLWQGGKVFRIVSMQRDLTKEHSYTLSIALNDERRKSYIWARRRNVRVIDTVASSDMMGVAYRALDANKDFRTNLNTNRLVVIYDDESKTLIPSVIANNTIIERMIAQGAVVSSKIDDNAVTTEKIAQGAVAAENMAYSSTQIHESSTINVSWDDDTKTITVGEGEYHSDIIGDHVIENEFIISGPDEGGEFIDSDSYKIYYNFQTSECNATDKNLPANEGYIFLGIMSAVYEKERIFTPRIYTTEPISASRVLGGTLRFYDVNGDIKAVKDTDETAMVANVKATSVEQIVGTDDTQGLRKRTKDVEEKTTTIEQEIGTATGSGILRDIALIKSSISGMRGAINGKQYSDCKGTCSQFVIPDLPWE